MRYPNFSEEKKLWKKGMKRVVGLDEAGRGPLAGPVIAGAVMLRGPFCNRKQTTKLRRKVLCLGVKDSKKISEKKREKIYDILINHPHIFCAMGRVSEKTIDRINILEATKLAMAKAIRSLEIHNGIKFPDKIQKAIEEIKIIMRSRGANV